MSDAKLTPWFPGSVKPARPGVYLRRLMPSSQSASYWRFTGAHWVMGGWDSPERALLRPDDDISPSQAKQWRGLASDPAKALGEAA